jgi:hypothetical protein
MLNEKLEQTVIECTAELMIANKELDFQNAEKEKRAAELITANQELSYQNEEKENSAAGLIISKAMEFDEFQKAVTSLGLYWMIVNQHP